MRKTPILNSHGIDTGTLSNTTPTSEPMISPNGQPACRMFSQCVLFLGNRLAVSGLITASQVPLPKAKSHIPTFRQMKAPSFPKAELNTGVAANVTTALMRCSRNATSMILP